ncbi:cobalamin biosynthesis protein [Streptomyces sp. enrichment culture]|uniref:cobalamin biosynthesis protein n=1 Tax=Streptomyces sp. enrichment culture TaxID=1795815 RepID=UPI003F57B150
MRLVVGVGARRGVSAREVCDLVAAVVREAGRGPEEVVALATVAAKADEPGLVEAAARLGVPLRAHPADVLARVRVPHPSGAALAAAGTPSVAEAAALAEAAAVAAAGTGAASGAEGAVPVDAPPAEGVVPVEDAPPAEAAVPVRDAPPAEGAVPVGAAVAVDGAAWGGGSGLTGSELLVPKRKPASGAARVTCAVAVAYGEGRLPSEAPGYHRGDAVFELRAPCRTADPRAGSPVRPEHATRWAADAVGPP